MNRYTATGLALAAADGHRVLVLTKFDAEVAPTLDTLAAAARDLTPIINAQAIVTRTTGGRHIRYPGGGTIHVRPATMPTGIHGVHTIYLTSTAATITDDEITASLPTTTGVDIIRD